jgi:hypothetical protein
MLIAMVHPHSHPNAASFDPDAWVVVTELSGAILQALHAQGYQPHCSCNGTEMGYRQREARMSLVCPPGTKQWHHCDCPLYQPPDELSPADRRALTRDVRIEGDLFFANLPNPLRQDMRPRPPRQKPLNPLCLPRAGRRKRRSRTTRLGLLAALAEKAGLTRFDPRMPSPSHWHPNAVLIEKVLQGGVSRGKCLADQVIVPHEGNRARVATRIESIRQVPGAHEQTYQYILGAIARLANEHKDGKSVEVAHLDRPIHVSRRALQVAIKRAGGQGVEAAMERMHGAKTRSHVLLFGRIEHRPDGTLRFLDLSLQLVSERWVPVQSGLELKAVNECADRGIPFHKPQQALPGLKYIPDLITLPGEDRQVVWEIAGLKTSEYLAHLRVKRDYYLVHFPGFFGIWNAQFGQEMPDFSTAVGACTEVWERKA